MGWWGQLVVRVSSTKYPYRQDKSVKVFFMIGFYRLKDAKNDGLYYTSQNFGQFEMSAPFYKLSTFPYA